MIYITQQQKEEWEAKISEYNNALADLENIPRERRNKEWDNSYIVNETMLGIYSHLSLNSIILPVEKSWDSICNSSFINGNIIDITTNFKNTYPNGVIIKLDK